MRSSLEQPFERVADFVGRAARADEMLFASLRGERSAFARFNRARLRQAGDVERVVARLQLVVGRRTAVFQAALPGVADDDERVLRAALRALRSAIVDARDDPHLALSLEATRSHRVLEAISRPDADELVDRIARSARGADLVGFLAAGEQMSAMASSLGHRHYHETGSWSFEFTVHGADAALRDKAVKSLVGGRDWDGEALESAIGEAIDRLPLLARPAVAVAPGAHRVLLSPRAVAELVSMLGWGGFSARALATGQSPLALLKRSQASFDSRIHLADDLQSAGVPLFQQDGFVRPSRLELLRGGALAGELVSPRSAREFALASTGAADDERPGAWDMAPGDLAEPDALAALGTGLSVSDLWYLNFSDRQSCRVTGMTRFATLWVQDGEPVGPVDPLRFDDSLYAVLGSELVALTRSAAWLPDTSTYDGRAFGGARVPGALVGRMSFTL